MILRCSFRGLFRTAMALLIISEAAIPQGTSAPASLSSSSPRDGHPETQSGLELLNQVITNQKKSDETLDTYERIERVEIRKNGSDPQPSEVRIARVIPTGVGFDHIPVDADGKPVDAAAYGVELEKLAKVLAWTMENGRPQRDAYDKFAKRRKDRNELIDATRTAFFYTFVAREPRAGHLLAKYSIEPNPAFKSTSRLMTIFTKVKGFVWIDEEARELARVEGEVTGDISIGLFLGKVYKGSHFMQERYEIKPGVWLPTFSQYDFDGRKFLASFSIHERTFFSNYRLLGPPKETLAAIQKELGHTASSSPADP